MMNKLLLPLILAATCGAQTPQNCKGYNPGPSARVVSCPCGINNVPLLTMFGTPRIGTNVGFQIQSQPNYMPVGFLVMGVINTGYTMPLTIAAICPNTMAVQTALNMSWNQLTIVPYGWNIANAYAMPGLCSFAIPNYRGLDGMVIRIQGFESWFSNSQPFTPTPTLEFTIRQ